MSQRMDGWEERLSHLVVQSVLEDVAAALDKPLRPVWSCPDDPEWWRHLGTEEEAAPNPQEGPTVCRWNARLPFTPVICVSASAHVDPGLSFN
jgi:hypothetical protein